jgi:hypothetical protein
MIRFRGFPVVASGAAFALCLGAIAGAQAPARGTTPQAPARGAAPPTAARPAAPSSGARIEGNLLQLMRGIVYPASNVVFAAQNDVSGLKPADDPAVSPNPLTSTYGGWQAVENAALALSESANLLALSGRMCSNGKPAPVQRADWQKYTQGLRDAGRAAYKAALSKNQDAMVDASGTVAEACSSCHEVYREKKDRCMP